MPYSTEVLSRAKARLTAAREDHQSRSAARLAQVYRQVPRIQTIDKQMQRNMVQAALAAFSKDAPDAMEEARRANRALEAERQQLLAAHFPEEYLTDQPFCPHCGGSGYLGSTMCQCLKALCVEEQRLELGAMFTGGESFDNFRLDYYPDTIAPQLGASPRTIMQKVFTACRNYARTFTPQAPNLLLTGGTGLGKTHLALSIGRAVGEMGCSVCYETAGSLFSKLEQAKFNPTDHTRRQAEKLEQCDLLILDDLGTEMPGQFTTAALYALLNSRLMARKPMVITTNLNVEDAGKRYSPQIASRLYGDFLRLTFVGTDIRSLKSRPY